MQTPTSLTFRDSIEAPWTAFAPIRLGAEPRLGEERPYKFLLVEEGGLPVRRYDLYLGTESRHVEAAILWRGWLAVGFGEWVCLVPLAGGRPQRLKLPVFFIEFQPLPECLLAVSGWGIARLEPDGSLAWHNDALGIDGVSLLRVADGVIEGEGEWDPPGGWQTFRASLATGAVITP